MRRPPFDLLLLAGCAILAVLLLGPVLIIPLHIPINYNEGWNALFDTRAVTPGSGPLYPPAGSFVFDNYPPLGFYVVGALGRFVFHDMIVAGRVVALASLFAAAALTGYCVWLLGGTRRAGAAAALFLLLYMATYYREYIAMDDPQWLAHAIMLAGLAVLLRAEAAGRRAGKPTPVGAIAAAALLMVAGGFVKHNLIALPLSVTAWFAWQDRRALRIWLAAAACGVSAGVVAVALLHGSDAFNDVLRHRRVFRLHLLTHSIKRLAPMLPMVIVAGLLLRRRPAAAPSPSVLFVVLFMAIATVTGVMQRLGEGVYYNAHFEALIAVCLGFGLALSAALRRPMMLRGRSLSAVPLALFAALPLIGAWPTHLPAAWNEMQGRTARAAAWNTIIGRVAAAPGPAGCIFMSVCWWAGKPSQVDVFNLTQSALEGGPLAGWRDQVAHGRFAIFEDDPASFTHGDAVRKLGHDPIMDAFRGHYAVVAHGPGGIVLLAPMPAATTTLSLVGKVGALPRTLPGTGVPGPFY